MILMSALFFLPRRSHQGGRITIRDPLFPSPQLLLFGRSAISTTFMLTLHRVFIVRYIFFVAQLNRSASAGGCAIFKVDLLRSRLLVGQSIEGLQEMVQCCPMVGHRERPIGGEHKLYLWSALRSTLIRTLECPAIVLSFPPSFAL